VPVGRIRKKVGAGEVRNQNTHHLPRFGNSVYFFYCPHNIFRMFQNVAGVYQIEFVVCKGPGIDIEIVDDVYARSGPEIYTNRAR